MVRCNKSFETVEYDISIYGKAYFLEAFKKQVVYLTSSFLAFA